MTPAAAPVAILRTRPETVRDDARRALDMIGFAPEPGATAVLGTMPAAWHLAAALEAARVDGAPAPASRLEPGVRTALLLTGVDLERTLGVEGALAALARLGEAGVPGGRREDPVDRALAAAAERLASGPACAFLVDATLAPGAPRPGAPRRARNLLLAGRDPVALDAAAARLCGLVPRTVPLIARAEAAGLGRADLAPDALLGDADALAGRPAATWRPGGGVLARLAGRLLGRLGRRADAAPSDSPWPALRREALDPESLEESRHV